MIFVPRKDWVGYKTVTLRPGGRTEEGGNNKRTTTCFQFTRCPLAWAPPSRSLRAASISSLNLIHILIPNTHCLFTSVLLLDAVQEARISKHTPPCQRSSPARQCPRRQMVNIYPRYPRYPAGCKMLNRSLFISSADGFFNGCFTRLLYLLVSPRRSFRKLMAAWCVCRLHLRRVYRESFLLDLCARCSYTDHLRLLIRTACDRQKSNEPAQTSDGRRDRHSLAG